MLTIWVVLGIIVLDQLTKYAVVLNMAENQSFSFIPGIMNFTYRKNTGVAFGMLSEHRWLFMIFTAIMLVVMLYFLIAYKKSHILFRLSVSFMFGGGLGNMLDRLFRIDVDGTHFVVDFFEFDFVNFAVFNVADIFITFGAILLFIFILFFEAKNPVFKKKEPEIIKEADENPEAFPEGKNETGCDKTDSGEN